MRICDFESTLIRLEEDITEQALLDQIGQLNNNELLDEYIVQLPLPKHIDEEKILLAIDSKKDVDGFHPANFGQDGRVDAFIPATPFGIMQLLERYQIPTSGQRCVVVGRSHIVGRPISILMSQKGPAGNAAVTVAHGKLI